MSGQLLQVDSAKSVNTQSDKPDIPKHNVAESTASFAKEALAQHKTQLQILANITQSKNAFLYFFSHKKSIHYGDRSLIKSLKWDALSDYLSSSKRIVEVIDSPVEGVYKAKHHALVLTFVLDESQQAIGILGCLVLISHAIKARDLDTVGLLAKDVSRQIQLCQQTQQLNQARQREVQMSELNQDYICVRDIRHKLVYANQAMLSTFPSKFRDKVIGNIDLPFYESEMSAQIIESELCALQNGNYVNTELVTLANGEDKILHTTKKRFTGTNGETFIMQVSRDVTEKEVLINDLKRSNGDLDNFAYVASHDLKSPLNVIKRLVTWVSEDCSQILPQDSKENLDLVLNRVVRMEKLLSDLLNYSRIGKNYQESSEINLKQVVVELLSLIDLPMGFSMNCDDINISVPDVPFNVVLLNLINNAIKHHDSGNAKIEIKARRNAKGATISILDNGPGIEVKNRTRIFKLFETLKPRDEVEGSGMGLSVVKKIVEHYGGRIIVEDNKPRGTKFIVSWPTTNLARSVLSGLHEDTPVSSNDGISA